MRIYIAQTLIDQQLGAALQLDGDMMHLQVPGGPMQLFISPAVLFVSVDGEGHDSGQLVGCVKTAQELYQLGAEHYDTSAVVGDVAYTVAPGFIGTPVGPGGTPTVLDPGSWQRLSAFLQQLDA
mgnify:CR=1 FL=1